MIEKPISDFLVTAIDTVGPDDTVARAAEVMAEHRSGCVVVVDRDSVAGIFTERDFLNRVAAADRDATTTRVADVMTADPETLHTDDTVVYAINRMAIGGYRHVPIIDADASPVGVLLIRDVVDHLADVFEDVERETDDDVEALWTDIGGGG